MLKRLEKVDENERKIKNLELQLKKTTEVLETRIKYLEKKLLQEKEIKKIDKKVSNKQKIIEINNKVDKMIQPIKNEILENADLVKQITINSKGNSL